MAGMSLQPIFGEAGIAGIQPMGSWTLQEKGKNLPVQAVTIRMPPTLPISSPNMKPGALIYV
jgi:hypothetical protein